MIGTQINFQGQVGKNLTENMPSKVCLNNHGKLKRNLVVLVIK